MPRRRIAPQVAFQITPMVDLTFLLLVFFMVTSKMSQEEVRTEIDLPVMTMAKVADDRSHRTIININHEGHYVIKDMVTSNEKTKEHLAKQCANSPPLRVYIRADRRTPARKIKELFAWCSEVGAVDVIIATYRSGQ